MEKKVYDALKEALKEVKVTVDGKEVESFGVIEGWEDSAGAKDKVQKANDDLVKDRDELKDKLKVANESITEKDKAVSGKDKEIERLQNDQLSEEDKKNLDNYKKKGMTTDKEQEMDAKINKLMETIEGQNSKVEELTTTIAKQTDDVTKAKASEQKQALRNDLVAELAKCNIKNPNNQKLAINTILADGQATITEEDGEIKRLFKVKRDGKSIQADTITELIEDFAKQNEQLVDSSGNSGSGNDHNSSGGNPNVDLTGKELSSLRDSAAAELEMKT